MEVQKWGVLSYLADWVHELDHLHERGLKIEWTFGGGLMWFAVLGFKHQKNSSPPLKSCGSRGNSQKHSEKAGSFYKREPLIGKNPCTFEGISGAYGIDLSLCVRNHLIVNSECTLDYVSQSLLNLHLPSLLPSSRTLPQWHTRIPTSTPPHPQRRLIHPRIIDDLPTQVSITI